ncbi:MAG: DUF6263 family protein [Planctomycetota bacterium]
MRRTWAVVLGASGLLLLFSAVEAFGGPPLRGPGKKVFLRLRLKRGQVYRVKTTMDQDITQKLPAQLGGQKQEIEQAMGMTYSFKVKDVDADGVMSCEVTYEAMQYKMKAPMMTVEYDSEDPPENVPMAARGFAAMVGQSFQAKFTPLGKTTELTGLDKIFDRVIEKMELPEGPMRKNIEKQLKTQFGDEAMKHTMARLTGLLFPEKAVGVGDSWKETVSVARPVALTMEQTMTLKKREEGVATVEVDTKVSPCPDAEPMKMGTVTMSYELKGTQTGTVTIDESTGWTTGGKLKQDLKGTMLMTGIPNAGELKIPMLMKSSVTLEQVEE